MASRRACHLLPHYQNVETYRRASRWTRGLYGHQSEPDAWRRVWFPPWVDQSPEVELFEVADDEESFEDPEESGLSALADFL